MAMHEQAGAQWRLAGDQVIGHRIVYCETTASTQQNARELLLAGAEHGTVVYANQQTKGRGRGGRTWVAPSRGLYTSMVLKPAMPIAQAPRLTALTCVGLLDGLNALGFKPHIKWPNDVVFAHPQSGPLGPFRKAAGILVELHTGPLRDQVPAGPQGWAAIVGFGINLSTPAEGWPTELEDRAIALDAVEDPPSAIYQPADVLRACVLGLETWIAAPHTEGLFARALDRLRKASATIGRQVKIPEEGIVGEAVGLDVDGACLYRPTVCSAESSQVTSGKRSR